MRGETGTASPGGSGVTPGPAAGERGREAHAKQSSPFVFVLDKHRGPLQPCPPARARKLLVAGRAVVARYIPFTIRIKDRTAEASQVDGVEVGVDPGSEHTGIAVFTEQAGEFRARQAIQLDHRGGQIRTKVAQRSRYRRRRRTVNKHGFPRLRLPRTKRLFGFATGGLVRATVPAGRWAGTHTGRVAVRSSGSHTVTTPAGAIKTSHKNLTLLQRGDGHAYTTKPEGGVISDTP
ncbi:RRXRR domain-containing protein [Actinomadura sp. KC345]|uniref:RRXRR domain-containing protein n=1 Tax=Actinomadura sp. KC345 TaxID=2530371 RepID=UPI001FB7B82F|nr:RRXRR domain-containing protein [Actinomadura sp. KC345]